MTSVGLTTWPSAIGVYLRAVLDLRRVDPAQRAHQRLHRLRRRAHCRSWRTRARSRAASRIASADSPSAAATFGFAGADLRRRPTLQACALAAAGGGAALAAALGDDIDLVSLFARSCTSAASSCGRRRTRRSSCRIPCRARGRRSASRSRRSTALARSCPAAAAPRPWRWSGLRRPGRPGAGRNCCRRRIGLRAGTRRSRCRRRRRCGGRRP